MFPVRGLLKSVIPRLPKKNIMGFSQFLKLVLVINLNVTLT